MATQRKALLKDLEDSLSSSTEQADQYDTQYKQSKKILEQLKSGAYSVNKCFLYLLSAVILVLSKYTLYISTECWHSQSTKCLCSFHNLYFQFFSLLNHEAIPKPCGVMYISANKPVMVSWLRTAIEEGRLFRDLQKSFKHLCKIFFRKNTWKFLTFLLNGVITIRVL